MRVIIILSLLCIASCSSLKSPDVGDLILAQKYVPGTEDLPVYSGFKPVDTNNIAYGSANGRIIDANYISSDANPEDVRLYYKETLAQLGWNSKKPSTYIRDGERLNLSITEKKGVTFLKFIIRPVG